MLFPFTFFVIKILRYSFESPHSLTLWVVNLSLHVIQWKFWQLNSLLFATETNGSLLNHSIVLYRVNETVESQANQSIDSFVYTNLPIMIIMCVVQ